MRIGTGYDVHRTGAARPLVLGGVTIPDAPGLHGHSDADVLTHAIIDALLGAACLGDIGQHFPSTDPVWRNASSRRMLADVVHLLERAGFVPYNVDATVVAEQPRLLPYIAAMRGELAATLRLPLGRVSVKATTTDGLGAIGRGEGLAAQAVVLIDLRAQE